MRKEKKEGEINLNEKFDEIEKDILELKQLKPKELEKRTDDFREKGHMFITWKTIDGLEVVTAKDLEGLLLGDHMRALVHDQFYEILDKALMDLPKEYMGRGRGGSILISPDGRGLVNKDNIGGSHINYKLCKPLEAKEVLENATKEYNDQIKVLTESKDKCDAVIKKIEEKE